MPFYRTENGAVLHIKCGRSRGRELICKFCRGAYREADGKMCDFPVGNGRTCDAQMCGNCGTTLGYQETPIGGGLKLMGDTIDVCPIHRTQAGVVSGKFQEAQ